MDHPSADASSGTGLIVQNTLPVVSISLVLVFRMTAAFLFVVDSFIPAGDYTRRFDYYRIDEHLVPDNVNGGLVRRRCRSRYCFVAGYGCILSYF